MNVHPGNVKSIGITTALILLNIGVIGVLALFPAVVDLLGLLFAVPIIGVLVYGAVISAGAYLSERGIRNGNMGMAGTGIVLLQAGYGLFGGGVLGAAVDPGLYMFILAGTAIVTVLVAVAAAGLVFFTGKDFSHWRNYAGYAFLGLIGTAFIGSLAAPVLIMAFIFALSGFFLLLVYEIWEISEQPENVVRNGIAVYTAFMGLFVHILQLVVRHYLRR